MRAAERSSRRRGAVSSAGSSGAFPVTVRHAFGETTIDAKPTRVATVAWANHEVPLALGVVPVGMSRASWGDDDGDGVLPWVEDRLSELGARTPVLFDETDGIDFEAVADTRPDVILAAYSGLSKSDYETLSKIAPTIAYPKTAWGTTLDEMIEMDGAAIGLGAEGKRLEQRLDARVEQAAERRPQLAGRSAMFASFDPADLSTVGFYTTLDPRARLFEDLGMTAPEAVRRASASSKEYYLTVSAEDAESLDDADVIVTYGDAALLKKLQADPLIGRIPAIARGSVVLLTDSTPLAAAANPSPLSVGAASDRYLDALAAAADEVG
ncbi:iron-siderophore ABC transporter substrate-binding protein [Amnibacterium kyonggiense]